MKYHQLDKPKKQHRKRVGRGIGSGYGKTAGRGTKGQNARTGGGVRPGFEGGQNPLSKRLPKVRGANSRHYRKDRIQLVHTDQLNRFKAGSKIDRPTLVEAGLIKDQKQPVKLLKRGELEKAVTVSLDAASASAASSVEASGGKFTKQGDN